MSSGDVYLHFIGREGLASRGDHTPPHNFNRYHIHIAPVILDCAFLCRELPFLVTSNFARFCLVQEDTQRDPNINQYSILKESISRREGESPILANLRPADPQLIPEILARQPTLLILVPSSNRMRKVMMKNITYPQFFFIRNENHVKCNGTHGIHVPFNGLLLS